MTEGNDDLDSQTERWIRASAPPLTEATLGWIATQWETMETWFALSETERANVRNDCVEAVAAAMRSAALEDGTEEPGVNVAVPLRAIIRTLEASPRLGTLAEAVERMRDVRSNRLGERTLSNVALMAWTYSNMSQEPRRTDD